MACYHPLSGFVYGVNPETGKKNIKIVPFGTPSVPGIERIEVPCGRCIGCRLEYSRQWANRCMLEAKYHEKACFVTLTYNSSHVPRALYPDLATGECMPALSLCKRDVQLFFKRLRKAFPDNPIRYFGCGEYGPSTFRPHYHLIIFGVNFADDRIAYRKSKTGNNMYTSPTLDKVWAFPPRDCEGSHTAIKPTNAGISTIQDVNWDTCCYTARYITKKLNGPEGEFYETFNIEKPFSVMSRRPGIGRPYYDYNGDLYSHAYIHLPTLDGGLKFSPPKYFDRLLEEDDPEQYAELKETRKKMAEAFQAARLAGTDLDYVDYLELTEETLQARIKSLKRGDF